MSPLEQVRAKVIEAVPEIVELKHGCILNLHAGESFGWMTIHRLRSICKKHKNYREECGAEENGCSIEEGVFGTSGTEDDEEWWQHVVKISDIKPYQIIGRPISLADVLRVMTNDGGNRWNLITYKRGELAGKAAFLRDDQERFLYWNLALPLDEQEPEVIEFLHKILCV